MKTPILIWAGVFVLAIILHGLLALGVRAARFWEPGEIPPAKYEPILLTFAPPQPQDPMAFTEQPEDRREQPPEDPDFLSNVDARARDRSDGQTDMPRMDGDLDFPSVPTEAGAVSPRMEEVNEEQREPVPRVEPGNKFSGLTKPGYLSKAEPQPPSGNFDLPQRPMENPEGGALLDGDVSLSTTEWEFSPWLMAFKRQFMRHWRAPYAYYSGLIHGWCILELEIAQDGTILSSHIVEENGDHSLAQVGLIAFNTAAPYLPLPKDFPDETLTIGIRLLYPPLRR